MIQAAHRFPWEVRDVAAVRRWGVSSQECVSLSLVLIQSSSGWVWTEPPCFCVGDSMQVRDGKTERKGALFLIMGYKYERRRGRGKKWGGEGGRVLVKQLQVSDWHFALLVASLAHQPVGIHSGAAAHCDHLPTRRTSALYCITPPLFSMDYIPLVAHSVVIITLNHG